MANAALGPGQRIGPYQLIEKLGSGGIGEVWKARDRRLSRIVALKFIATSRRGSSPIADLLREARAASALNHPNIVTIFEVGESDSGTYLAMEFVQGETLRNRLRRPPLPLEEALDIATQIAAGLGAAHEQGIVHRDLKPENIMLRADGYVKLLDFGLAKLLPWSEAAGAGADSVTVSSIATEPGQLVGTLTCMSPEQARGQPVTPASDVFSFGIVLYEMLTLEHPFRAGTALDTLTAILTKEPLPVSTHSPAVPAPVAEVVERCLRKEPTARFSSVTELSGHLRTAKALQAAPLPEPGKLRHQPRWVQALGAGLIALLLLLSGWFLRPSASDRGVEAPAVRSVAVMNFRADADDSRAAPLARGLPDEVSGALPGMGLNVASRSRVAELEGGADPQAIGAQLGVDAVLGGTVRSYGARFKVYIELVSTRTGFQIWSATLTTEGQDLIESEQKTAADIAAKLRAELPARK
jgi:serine/threonine protein kinase